MNFWLRYFPIFVRPKWSRTYWGVGTTNDRWQGSNRVTVKERSWEGLASITFRNGTQSATFYGESISKMRASLFELPLLITRKDVQSPDHTIFGGVGLTYNYSHPVVGRGRVFDSQHPENSLYSNSLYAVFHDDGAISAVLSSKRPWHMMQVAFAPGFFDCIQRYLAETQSKKS
jgi:hypothetical protein